MRSLAMFIWFLPVVVHVMTAIAALIHPWMRQRTPRRTDRPAASLILPVHGSVAAGEECLTSAFSADYPALELLICAQHASADVLAMIERVAAAFPDRPYRIVRGDDDFAASPKIDNIAEAYRTAQHDILIIKDDAIRLKPGQIDKVLRELTEDVGMVVSVPIIRQTGGFAGLVEQSYVNIHSGRWLMAGAVFGMGFGIGKLCAFRRSEMDRAGGLASIAHTIAEDNAMSKQLKAIGLSTVITETMADQVSGERSFRQVWDRQVRWVVCRRIEEPCALIGELCFSFVMALLGAVFTAVMFDVSPLWTVLSTVAIWALMDGLYSRFIGERYASVHLMAGLVRDCLFPFVLIAGICARNVEWEARSVRLLLLQVG